MVVGYIRLTSKRSPQPFLWRQRNRLWRQMRYSTLAHRFHIICSLSTPNQISLHPTTNYHQILAGTLLPLKNNFRNFRTKLEIQKELHRPTLFSNLNYCNFTSRDIQMFNLNIFNTKHNTLLTNLWIIIQILKIAWAARNGNDSQEAVDFNTNELYSNLNRFTISFIVLSINTYYRRKLGNSCLELDYF